MSGRLAGCRRSVGGSVCTPAADERLEELCNYACVCDLRGDCRESSSDQLAFLLLKLKISIIEVNVPVE